MRHSASVPHVVALPPVTGHSSGGIGAGSYAAVSGSGGGSSSGGFLSVTGLLSSTAPAAAAAAAAAAPAASASTTAGTSSGLSGVREAFVAPAPSGNAYAIRQVPTLTGPALRRSRSKSPAGASSGGASTPTGARDLLRISPSEVALAIEDGSKCSTTLLLDNPSTSDLVAFKIKTTVPERYLVTPSMGVVAPGHSLVVNSMWCRAAVFMANDGHTWAVAISTQECSQLALSLRGKASAVAPAVGDKFLFQTVAVESEEMASIATVTELANKWSTAKWKKKTRNMKIVSKFFLKAQVSDDSNSDDGDEDVLQPLSKQAALSSQRSVSHTPAPVLSPSTFGAMPPPFEWERCELIGRGRSAGVYRGIRYDTGADVAVKVLEVVTQRQQLQLQREVSVMRELSHPNLIQFFGVEVQGTAPVTVSLVLEYAPGGSILQLLQRDGAMSEPVAAQYARDLLAGLACLHGHQVAHRDVKGANVLIGGDGHGRLADFGTAKSVATSFTVAGFESPREQGTPNWMAPEVVTGTVMDAGWFAADVWSVGCTVIEMLTGRPPWPAAANVVAALYTIAASSEMPPFPDTVSKRCKSFLKACLRRHPGDRASAKQLLKHPFITGKEHESRSSRELPRTTAMDTDEAFSLPTIAQVKRPSTADSVLHSSGRRGSSPGVVAADDYASHVLPKTSRDGGAGDTAAPSGSSKKPPRKTGNGSMASPEGMPKPRSHRRAPARKSGTEELSDSASDSDVPGSARKVLPRGRSASPGLSPLKNDRVRTPVHSDSDDSQPSRSASTAKKLAPMRSGVSSAPSVSVSASSTPRNRPGPLSPPGSVSRARVALVSGIDLWERSTRLLRRLLPSYTLSDDDSELLRHIGVRMAHELEAAAAVRDALDACRALAPDALVECRSGALRLMEAVSSYLGVYGFGHVGVVHDAESVQLDSADEDSDGSQSHWLSGSGFGVSGLAAGAPGVTHAGAHHPEAGVHVTGIALVWLAAARAQLQRRAASEAPAKPLPPCVPSCKRSACTVEVLSICQWKAQVARSLRVCLDAIDKISLLLEDVVTILSQSETTSRLTLQRLRHSARESRSTIVAAQRDLEATIKEKESAQAAVAQFDTAWRPGAELCIFQQTTRVRRMAKSVYASVVQLVNQDGLEDVQLLRSQWAAMASAAAASATGAASDDFHQNYDAYGQYTQQDTYGYAYSYDADNTTSLQSAATWEVPVEALHQSAEWQAAAATAEVPSESWNSYDDGSWRQDSWNQDPNAAYYYGAQQGYDAQHAQEWADYYASQQQVAEGVDAGAAAAAPASAEQPSSGDGAAAYAAAPTTGESWGESQEGYGWGYGGADGSHNGSQVLNESSGVLDGSSVGWEASDSAVPVGSGDQLLESWDEADWQNHPYAGASVMPYVEDNSVPFKVRALAKYTAGGETELSLYEGEVILVWRTDPSGWWEGQTDDGRVGWFPSNFVHVKYDLYPIVEVDTPRSEGSLTARSVRSLRGLPTPRTSPAAGGK